MELKINLRGFDPKHIYKRNSTNCFYDSFRQMLVPLTNHNLLIYRMEMYAYKIMGVPKECLYASQSVRKYGINSTMVMDIVIHEKRDEELKPVAIIECRPLGKRLEETMTVQIEENAKKMGVNYIIVTNGTEAFSFISRPDRISYWRIDNIPKYDMVCAGQDMDITDEHDIRVEEAAKVLVVNGVLPPTRVVHKTETPEVVHPTKFNLDDTPDAVKPFVKAFVKGLKDTSVKIGERVLGDIHVFGDAGLRRKSAGYGSEKQNKGWQRIFLITDFYGSNQLVGIDVAPGQDGQPILSVSLDDYESRQVVLSLNLNKFMSVSGEKVHLAYDVKRAFPKEDDDFVESFIEIVEEKIPGLIKKGKVVFATFESSVLEGKESLTFENEAMVGMVMNLTAFALLVDEHREILKSYSKIMK